MVRVPDTGEMVLKPDRYFVNAEGGTVNLGARVWRQNVTFCGKRKYLNPLK